MSSYELFEEAVNQEVPMSAEEDAQGVKIHDHGDTATPSQPAQDPQINDDSTESTPEQPIQDVAADDDNHTGAPEQQIQSVQASINAKQAALKHSKAKKVASAVKAKINKV